MDLWMMIVLVVFIGCGAGVITEYLKTQRREREHTPNDDVYDEVEMLRERVEVLEKIVTDERYQLEREIDQLERRA